MANLTDVVKEMHLAWNKHDAAKIASFYAEDCLYENEPAGVSAKGREAVKAMAENVFTAFPDVKLEMKNVFASGNFTAGEMVMSGTHKGQAPGAPPPTGKSFSVKLCAIIEFQWDLVKHNSVYWDMASLMRQTGQMPPATP